jgi:sialate O-acetylesterase
MNEQKLRLWLAFAFSVFLFWPASAPAQLAPAQAPAEPSTQSELSLPHFFRDHMVVQRQRPVSIWGTAVAGAEVTVKFKDSTAKTTANADGKWRLAFNSGQADSYGASIVVTSGNTSKTIEDVLVGEVWLASGQSNMAFTMNRVPEYSEVIASADYPNIRMFNAPTVTAVDPQDDIDGVWTKCGPQTVGNYSAVAFFFARKLHQELGVPIGVIKTAWGGKPVETFTSRDALRTLPATKKKVDETLAMDADYDHEKALGKFQQQLEQWKARQAEWQKKPADKRGRMAKKPARPKRPLDTEGRPGVLFNSMIHPFIGYTMRGAIWYQGEANAKPGAVPYDETLPLMIRDWRSRWNDDFSFLFVQLANYRFPSTNPGTPDDWALLQDRMRKLLKTTPKTGMAVINDVGEANDIHPKNKKDPGERLALWALANDYGRDIVYSGPLYESSKVSGKTIEVTFDHVGSGLRSRDGGPLKRFEIAGADQIWKWGNAEIKSPDQVIISHPEIPEPVAVRYAWASNPEGANLVNSEGLPTSVFRTDDWKISNPDAPNANRTSRKEMVAKVKALTNERAKFDRESQAFKEASEQINELKKRIQEFAK